MGKAMTIADFADGRVLGLLREGVQDSPWHQDRNDGYPKLNDADNTVSGISDIVVDKSLQTHKIFNLQGHFVGTELKALPIGIYIMNGKKICTHSSRHRSARTASGTKAHTTMHGCFLSAPTYCSFPT